MKNFKLIFLFTVVSAFNSNLVAQEKQNDATWEETISFLEENISRLNLKEKNRYNGKVDYSYYEYFIEQDKLTNRIKINSTWDKSAHLKDIESFRIYRNGDNSIEINLGFLKNSVQTTANNSGPYSRFVLPLCSEYIGSPQKCEKNLFELNDKFLKRLETAFKHLAYLANEKRKKSKF